MSWFEGSFYGNAFADWTLALAIAIGALVVLWTVKFGLIRRLRRLATRTPTRLDDGLLDLASRTKLPFLLILSLYAGAQALDFSPKSIRLIDSVVIIALLVQVAFWGNRAIVLWLMHYMAAKREENAAAATTTAVMGFIARLALWSVVVLMILDNLGFNITALVASLGVGGIAVALAVQNILGDIFASLSIALDKPFVIGDFIIVDDVLGTVEYIGLKTTRLRSLSGEQVVFSNADLLKSRIRNYKRMFERRVLFHFGVIYQTTHEQLARIPGIVREIVTAQDKTRFDRAHFQKYGDSSLDFEVVYYVKDPDYNIYMDIQQAINLELFRRLAAEGIDFAYPTRTLYLNQLPLAKPS